MSISERFFKRLSSVSGYNNLDTAKAQGAFITEAHNKCSAGTWNRQMLLHKNSEMIY